MSLSIKKLGMGSNNESLFRTKQLQKRMLFVSKRAIESALVLIIPLKTPMYTFLHCTLQMEFEKERGKTKQNK